MDIKIEKGIPITNSCGRRPKYPWAQLQVGDSFLASGASNPMNVTNSRMLAERKYGFKFAARSTPDGVRVWRIA